MSKRGWFWTIGVVGALVLIIVGWAVISSSIAQNANDAKKREMYCDMMHTYGTVDYDRCVS